MHFQRFHLVAGFFTVLLLGFFARTAFSVVDNTTCMVLNDSDSVDEFNSLRRKMVEGFNREEHRACTEWIHFSPGEERRVELNSTLEINNPNDLDCSAGQGKPAVCGDGWGLILDGTTAPSVILDASKLPEGTCAVRIRADRVLLKGLAIRVHREEDAICNEGGNNDTTGVEVIPDDPRPPSPSPTPSPSPSPSPTPSPSPSPTPSPSPSPSPSPTPSPTASPTPSPSPSPSPTPTGEPDDPDSDGVPQDSDNCPDHPNAEQTDSDGDGIGDTCDDDFVITPGDDDGDGVGNENDNCDNAANPNQADADQDGIGDACDTDMDVKVPDPFPGFSEPPPPACALGHNSRTPYWTMWILLFLAPVIRRLLCRKACFENHPPARSTPSRS